MLKICEDTYYKASDELNFEELFEYKATTSTKKITYFDDILAFDIETSSFKEFDPDNIREKDDAVYHHLLGTKIRISQQMFSDIPDLNVMRRALFGKIYFSRNDRSYLTLLPSTSWNSKAQEEYFSSTCSQVV